MHLIISLGCFLFLFLACADSNSGDQSATNSAPTVLSPDSLENPILWANENLWEGKIEIADLKTSLVNSLIAAVKMGIYEQYFDPNLLTKGPTDIKFTKITFLDVQPHKSSETFSSGASQKDSLSITFEKESETKIYSFRIIVSTMIDKKPLSIDIPSRFYVNHYSKVKLSKSGEYNLGSLIEMASTSPTRFAVVGSVLKNIGLDSPTFKISANKTVEITKNTPVSFGLIIMPIKS